VPSSPGPDSSGPDSSGPDLTELRTAVGDDHVLTDPDLRAGSERDWTGRFSGPSIAIVRPATVEQVAQVLRWCHEHDVAVVPQGGNTGLVGGGVPGGLGEADGRPTIVLSLRRLDSIGPVDGAAGQVTVGAGVVLARLQEAARTAGWAFAVDLSARGSATVGGMVATNAGGLHVVRWGSMRAQVVGVEAVLASGEVIRHLGGLLKDNTGYDLTGLLVGSEGTLAVVTAARLRLVPPIGPTVTALVACTSVADAVALAAEARRSLPGVVAIEAVWPGTLGFTARAFDLVVPVDLEDGGVALLAEVDETAGTVERLAAWSGDRPVAVATDSRGRAGLWALRERIADAIALSGIPHKLDVTLPFDRIAPFAAAVVASLPGLDVHLFGHLGDGNLHVNVLGAPPHDETVDDCVLRLVVELGGSISAEHGIGRAKRAWLPLCRSPAELETFRAIKAALDPRSILNPGVLLD
jgi:FAD/FMN-containing dehydrogenase